MIQEYNPYELGKRLFRQGLGVSDIWGAVLSDNDQEECYRGYLEQKWSEERPALWARLGYTRTGLNNQ